jgi:glycosyltransferase involved in cell wall biosynthesis
MTDLAVSIIVVSLNTKKDFLKTLNSILSQKFSSYEIIVIDGDSKDGTIEEIEKNKRNISKYIIEKDKGIYDAMNKGINISKGRWIIFLNSGDIFYDNNVLLKFSEYDLKNNQIVYGDTIIDNDNIKYLIKSNMFTDKTILMPFCHQSCFVRSSIFKNQKFILDYKISSDFNFFVQSYINNINFFKANFIISQVKAGGLSDTSRKDVLEENILILKKTKNKKIYILYFLKILENIKYLIKLIIPKKILNFLLKIKYRNMIILK